MWPGADMTAMGELVLVLGLLVSAHCEVRARDPEVEEEEELHPRATETPPVGERDNQPTQIGNWCAFVKERVVTMAVVCGKEKHTIKSQSPCPAGIPDCHVVMYKLSTRPVYTQRQTIITALHWRCCPGHGGNNCEDTVPDPQLDSGGLAVTAGSEPERTEPHGPDELMRLQQQRHQGDQNHQQDNDQASVDNSTHPAQEPGHAHNNLHTSHHATNTNHPHPHHPHPHQQQEHLSEGPAALPVPHMMALVKSQLQPVLQGFNRSLEHLSRQVGDLAHDVALLKSSRQGPELPAGPLEGPELDEAAEQRLEARLDEVFQNIREVQRQMESQQTDMENRLHSQHAMLHYNLTSVKTDIDMKLKRQQQMLQVSLQAVNTTQSEFKLDEDQTTEAQLDLHLPFPSLPPPWPPQPSDSSTLWEAIKRLDNMVVNNTVKMNGLMEDVEVTSGNIQQLRQDCKELERQLNQTARNSQILFMQTGLEVEDAKVVVLKRVEELAGNLTQHNKQLQDMEEDVDYLYTALYHNHSAADCDCKGLKADVVQLQRGVANVTALAHENRIALDKNSEGGAEHWSEASDREQAVVEALQHDLQQVKESLASEWNRTRTLDHGLNQLSSVVTVRLAELSGLKESDRKLWEEMHNQLGSFKSLLKDVIRHSDVLELLLGEEVLEFLEWPVQDQEANSIPALKEQLRLLQERVTGHNLSITSLLGNRPGGREEVLSADQPSSSHLLPDDWLPGGMRKSNSGEAARERQLLLHPDGRRLEHRGDGSDLWNLEKMVEELGLKVLQLEEMPCPCPNTSTEREGPSSGVDAKLQAEVTWLKRGLEEHLRVFKNIFSNADVLAASDATLELDKLWQLVRSKDGRKEKKRGGGREATGRGGNHRNRRELSGVAPVLFGKSDDSLLFVAGSPLNVSDSGLVFQPSLNRGQFYRDSGTFTAPLDGIYLFILTLDLRLGPTHVVLRRGSGNALVSLHQQEVTEVGPATGVGLLLLREGEEVRLELRGGVWAESEDNVFTGLLLHRTS